MVTIKEILDCLEAFAPSYMAMGFDNVGLLAGFPEREVTRVLCALDVTEEVIAEAEGLGAELIAAHHPLIFHPLKALRTDDPVGRKLIRLVRGGRSAICMHTNLDAAAGGVNDALAEALGLLIRTFEEPESGAAEEMLALVLVVEGLCEELSLRHIARIRAGTCSQEQGDYLQRPSQLL